MITVARGSRPKRFAAAIALASLALLVTINAALNLGVARPILTRLISVDAQSFNLEYRIAWSFWPTLVYVRDLRLRGNDSNVQWEIEIDRARASVDLVALVKREFHATKVRADGIAVRIRQKLDFSDATTERVAPLAPISGFPGPPLIEEGPPPGDVSDKDYDLWSVRIENVEGRARQLWIDEVHFEGDIHVAGSFALRPKRQLAVGPANATIDSGSVMLGLEKILDHVVGKANCTIPAFDPRPITGYEVFRFVSGAVQLDALIPNATALNHYARMHGSSALVAGGTGVLHVDGSLRSGVVKPLALSLTLDNLRAKWDGWVAFASVQLTNVTNATGPNVSRLRATAIELHQTSAKAIAFRTPELHVQASTQEIDLSKQFAVFAIHGDLPTAELPDLRLVNTLFLKKSELHVDDGKASLSAAFDASTGTNRASGTFMAGTERVAGHKGPLHFAGRFDVTASVEEVLLDSGDLDGKVVIDASHVALRDAHATVSDWWSHIELRELRVRPEAPMPLDVNFAAKLSNATPVLAFSKRVPDIPGWIARFFTAGQVIASGRVRVGKARIELSNLKAQTGALAIVGGLRNRGDALSGAFQVSSGPLSVGIELKNDETKLIFVGKTEEPALTTP